MNRYILVPVLLLCALTVLAQPANRPWDKKMTLTRCNIHITNDAFTATTFIEMEFANNGPEEIEGLTYFNLAPGQVITGFQLMLNGKYRDGSIEEKWKATNAYNQVVGKRIDPALLSLESNNHYSLRIYPIPARGSRRVTMTIQQEMIMQNDSLFYQLPLKFTDTVQQFNLSIQSHAKTTPVTGNGLIQPLQFDGSTPPHQLYYTATHMVLNRDIAYAIPLSYTTPDICTRTEEDKNYFAIRLWPDVTPEYTINPTSVTVFWDISGQQYDRDEKKEIAFLEKLFRQYPIKQLVIKPFHQRVTDSAVFYQPGIHSGWKQYLQQLTHESSTNTGCIDLTRVQTQLALLFTDGFNTYGKADITTGSIPLHIVHSGKQINQDFLRLQAAITGGNLIDIGNDNMDKALSFAGKASRHLLAVRNTSGHTIVDELPGSDLSRPIVLTGETKGSDTLIFCYGNNNIITTTQMIEIPAGHPCAIKGIERINMLRQWKALENSQDWNALVDFGLLERVVTRQTSFIVLERIEDYIRYNIATPPDMEAECKQHNYVRRDTRTQRIQTAQQQKMYNLQWLVNQYNQRLTWFDAAAKPIQLTANDQQMMLAGTNQDEATTNQKRQLAYASAQVAPMSINESNTLSESVVVTAYSVNRRRAYTGSATVVSNNYTFFASQDISTLLAGRVPGLQVTSSNGTPGSASKIVLRGARSFSNNNAPLYVIDGMPVNDGLQDIPPDDIDNITVLKDAAGTALYGSRGTNGVIIITTKKGRYTNYREWSSYTLDNQEDVDYLQEMKAADRKDKYTTYLRLNNSRRVAGFYIDMAEQLFINGFITEAKDVLGNAAEKGNGNMATLLAVAFTLESWKEYDAAINIYKGLLVQNQDPVELYRNIAWAYYQKGDYQAAVNTLFNVISGDYIKNNQYYYSYHYSYGNRLTKLLEEMNAMISAKAGQLDVSAIPKALIRPIPTDLRVIVQTSYGYLNSLKIKEPDGSICSTYYQNNYNYPPNQKQSILDYAYLSHVYSVQHAKAGKYRISLQCYNGYQVDEASNQPHMIRIISIRNFGKADQHLEVLNVIVDNQYGEVEIGAVKVE